MDHLLQDLRHAIRALRKNPGFTAAAIVTLAVGTGANVSNFAIINAFLLRPLPYKDPERLVQLDRLDRKDNDLLRFSLPTYMAFREQNQVFEALGAYDYTSRNLAARGEPAERFTVGRVTTNLFPLLGAPAVLGRTFVPREQEPGHGHVVLMSYALWRARFGEDRHVLGRTITLDGIAHTVIGVMPEHFTFPYGEVKLWVPIELDFAEFGPMYRNFMLVGRLRPGMSRTTAAEQLSAHYRASLELYPADGGDYAVNVAPLRERLIFLYETVTLLFGLVTLATAFVLLIVCANVANLLLARAVGRARDIAVRRALGAGKGRLVRQLLTEAAVLSAVGGAIGATWAYAATRNLRSEIPEALFRVGEIHVDGTALVFTLAVSGVTALLSGLWPALHSSKTDIAGTLRAAETWKSARGVGRRAQNVLVVSQIALSVILLVGTTLMVQSFFRMQRVDLGFDTDTVLTVEVQLPEEAYPDAEHVRGYYTEMLRRIRALPGVQDAGLVNPLPLNFESYSAAFTAEGRGEGSGDRESAGLHVVTPGYFDAMGMTILSGRGFGPEDAPDAPPVVVVSRTLSGRYWSDGDAIGRSLRFYRGDDESDLVTVIGIVNDTKQMFVNETQTALLYVPHAQRPHRRAFLVIRTAGDPMAFVPVVRQEAAQVDPAVPLSAIRSMDQVIGESLTPWVGGTLALSGLSLFALFLAALGVYAVVAYAVGRRTREIGLRVALGAEPRDVVRLALRQGFVLTVVGIAIGLAVAFALTRMMSALLFGVKAADPATFATVAVALVGVALLATLVPVRRALRINPVEALRSE